MMITATPAATQAHPINQTLLHVPFPQSTPTPTTNLNATPLNVTPMNVTSTPILPIIMNAPQLSPSTATYLALDLTLSHPASHQPIIIKILHRQPLLPLRIIISENLKFKTRARKTDRSRRLILFYF